MFFWARPLARLSLPSVMSWIRSDTPIWKLALSQSCSPRIKGGWKRVKCLGKHSQGERVKLPFQLQKVTERLAFWLETLKRVTTIIKACFRDCLLQTKKIQGLSTKICLLLASMLLTCFALNEKQFCLQFVNSLNNKIA